jgi:hypothetical protein
LSYVPPPDAVDVDDAADDTRDATPMPCLSPPLDVPPSRDVTPMPCLTPPPPDGG